MEMKRNTIAFLILVTLLGCTKSNKNQPIKPDFPTPTPGATPVEDLTKINRTIWLNSKKDLEDAKHLYDVMMAHNDKVKACIEKTVAQNKRKEIDSCYCKFPVDRKKVGIERDAQLKAHPEWKKSLIQWWRDEKKNYSFTISFGALETMIDLQCSK